ncbi:hypothetical protein [Streptomyces sp. NPDC060002]|uniref:hypothetical protein n=1 Tax=Streptomyces sp. NPDC060002 TaxID=3347033 RepID=UPI0036B04048
MRFSLSGGLFGLSVRRSVGASACSVRRPVRCFGLFGASAFRAFGLFGLFGMKTPPGPRM